MREFDLFEYQTEARECLSAQELFQIWDRVSSFYESGKINSSELSEMKEVIWPRLRSMTALKNMIDNAVSAS